MPRQCSDQTEEIKCQAKERVLSNSRRGRVGTKSQTEARVDHSLGQSLRIYPRD